MKVLLIGRGLSGAILSLELHSRGIAHHIIDMPTMSLSSKVAAGLVNPIVLKRLNLVQGALDFMPVAKDFYRRWEEILSSEFYHELPIRHIFTSNGELNDWMEKSSQDSYGNFLGEITPNNLQLVKAPFGLGDVKQCGWLDTIKFLELHKTCSQPNYTIEETEYTEDYLDKHKSGYDKVIFCTGHLMREQFPATSNAFAPTRGEVLTITSDYLPTDVIIHGPVFIMPVGKGKFKVGATYAWDDLSDTPTRKGQEELKAKLEKIFIGDYTIIDHQAGVRPNVKDRKPLIGKIGENIYSFNGMGSRAVLMAPYLAKVFIDGLLSGTKLPDQYDIVRYIN